VGSALQGYSIFYKGNYEDNMSTKKEFWKFVAERQENWYYSKILNRPIIGGDKILRKYRFCNVYRFLDRGTIYPIEKFLWLKEPLTAEDLVFRVVLYRILNRPDTWEYIGQGLDEFNLATFKSKILSLIGDGKKLYDGLSYKQFTRIITAKKGLSTTERFVLAAKELVPAIWNLTDVLSTETDGERVLYLIRRFSPNVWIGSFCAFQILLDLTYLRFNSRPLSPININEWVHCGIGSERGAKLMGMDDPLEAIKILHGSQPEWLPFLMGRSNKPIKLSFPDIEHALCEFFKYHRIKSGGFKRPYGETNRKWQPKKPYPPWAKGKIRGI